MNRTSLVATLGLVVLGLGSTVTNLGNQYAQDDMPVIQKNPIVHSLADPGKFFTESYWPKPFPPALYRPLATTGFAVQWQIGGGRPWVFRVTSIAMYLATGLAVYHLAALLLPALAAWLVAAFFIVHPVHVEAVAVAVNQSEVMVGLLATLTVILYLGLRRRHRLEVREGALLFGLYLAATLFKETGLMVMGLIVAAELTIVSDHRPMRERLAELRPLLLVMLLGATSFFAIRTFALGGDPVGTFAAEAFLGQGMGGRALTMLGVVKHWYRLLLWPAHLQGDYSPREIEAADSWGADQTLGALLVALAVITAIASWRRRPVVTFGLLWVAVGIFPVSNVLIPTGIALAERTLFLPSIGMMLVVGGLAVPVIERVRKSRPLQGLAAAAVVAILAMGVSRSASRQRVWHDQLTYWGQTAIDAPLSYRAHHALATLLFQAGLRGQAEREYRIAIALFPKQFGVYFDFANKLRLAGLCPGAVRYYRQTLLIDLRHEQARSGLIACLLHLGQYEDAVHEAREGLSFASDSAAVRVFGMMAMVADSARRVGAPAGTVRLTIPSSSPPR